MVMGCEGMWKGDVRKMSGWEVVRGMGEGDKLMRIAIVENGCTRVGEMGVR